MPPERTETNCAWHSNPRALFALAALVLLVSSGAMLARAQSPVRSISFPTPIKWNRQRGVSRYRLQIAADESFRNIFFDGPVSGEHYVVNNLAAGYYYWRVAPADSHPGNYSRPVRFFVSGGVVITPRVSSRARASWPVRPLSSRKAH